ncbi:MAG: peptidoglycan DD-metalloendopeptidase family protein [Paracoccaceae bacterium]|nr:peptidoglycan DD-metalloendopeptidase family protein [Paracoccaceae bacterium]
MRHSALVVGLAASALALTGCSEGSSNGGFFSGLDIDLRGSAGQLDTSDAARNAAAKPRPDDRGIISYPGYQVAVARRGDTVRTVAARIGLPAEELARHNVLPDSVILREGEILALPRRVEDPIAPLGGETLDVATIAGTAIDRADGGTPGLPTGSEPQRHRVRPGETAFSIARTYGVPVAELADWNGLGSDLALRVGQYLLIPLPPTTAGTEDVRVASIEQPGAGSVTPLPPSSAEPLPTEDVEPVAAAPEPEPEPLEDQQTAASDTSKLRMPVQGSIVRPYEKGKNEGIGISASAGSTVVAADDGTVAAITRDTDQVPILVIRHAGNLLTVYAGVDEIEVEKGDSVRRGEQIAVVRAAAPPFLHFEVREGFDSVDPDPYLN